MNHTNYYGKKAIGVFFGCVIGLSAVAEILICRYQRMWAYPLLMWMPAVSAAVASVAGMKEASERFTLKKLFWNTGFRSCKIRYVLAGMLIPLVYLLIPYMLYWRMQPENFAYNGVALGRILADCLPAGIIGVFINLLTAAGEEIGWRGFLFPALHREAGLERTLLITGLFWCLWHFPLLIWGGYMQGPSLAYSLIAFVLCIFPVAVICGLLRMESGSVWPCAFLHAAHNNYDQAVFDLITRGEDKMFYVSETGIFTIACTWMIAVVMYIHYKKHAEIPKS